MRGQSRLSSSAAKEALGTRSFLGDPYATVEYELAGNRGLDRVQATIVQPYVGGW